MSKVWEDDNYKVEVLPDDTPESPREWDNLGTMVTWHRQHNLGDEQPKCSVYDWLESLAVELDPKVEDKIDFWKNGKGWSRLENENPDNSCKKCDEIVEDIIMDTIHKHAILLPLYLYDHSGITISTSSFSCPWDSGQVGYIYVSVKDALKGYDSSWKKMTKKRWERIITYLKGEVETYDQYLRGDIYGFIASKKVKCESCGDVEEEETDSCWGFYGSDIEENGMLDHIPDEYHHLFDGDYSVY